MIVIFGANNSWISRIIRLVTGSKWSHVAILDNDDCHVIEARGGYGVQRNNVLDFLGRYELVEYRFLPGDIEKARKLIGKPFDNKGVKGILFRNFEHCPDSWFCSELVAHAANFVPDFFAHKHTPESLYNLTTRLPE